MHGCINVCIVLYIRRCACNSKTCLVKNGMARKISNEAKKTEINYCISRNIDSDFNLVV